MINRVDEPAATMPTAESQAGIMPVDLEFTKVLLVEDDPGHSHLIRQMIMTSSSAYQVTCAESINDATRHLKSDVFDAVITDLTLPDGSGLDSVREIRQFDAMVPIIVLTMLEDSRLEALALQYGAQDYISKTQICPEVLRRAIQHAIHRQQSIAQAADLFEKLKASRQQLKRQKQLLKKKNRRLKRLYHTAQRFVDNVSHEFRTPLTVIKDYVLLVREGMCGEVNSEQAHMLDIAAVRVNDLNTMVDDLLDISKLEAGMLSAWRRKCNLPEIMQAVEPSLRQKAAIRDIHFLVDLPADLPEVYCDAEKAGRVIINLVVNAIKFCPDGGVVRVHAHADRDAGEVRVAVTDNGHGIAAEDLERIFQRFEQLNCNLRQSTKGFGLGLNIARELTAINLGALQVESQLGEGSTFSFSVPFSEPIEVAKRYLKQLRTTKKSLSLISAYVLRAANTATARDVDDTDLCLTGLLRQNDLLWRLGTHYWLILAATNPAEDDRLLQRMSEEFQKIKGLRPLGPLPELTTIREGAWRVLDNSDECLAHLAQLFNGDRTAGAASATSASEKLAENALSPANTTGVEKKSVLIVDDDPEVCLGVAHRLEAMSFRTQTVFDGQQALAAVELQPPDVIILDINMPVLDGFSVLSELKKSERTKNIPVIMLSACVREKRRALAAGAGFFIDKPYRRAALIAAVDAASKVSVN